MIYNSYKEYIKQQTLKYGKNFILEILDLMIIGYKIKNEEMRELLLKNKVIKRTTKTINYTTSKHNNLTFIQGQGLQETDDIEYGITIKNGRNQVIFNLHLTQSIIPEVLEMINTCN